MDSQEYSQGEKIFKLITVLTIILSMIMSITSRILFPEEIEIFSLFFAFSLTIIFLYLMNRGNSLAKWALVLVNFLPVMVNYLTASLFFSKSIFTMIWLGLIGISYLILGVFILINKKLNNYINYRSGKINKNWIIAIILN